MGRQPNAARPDRPAGPLKMRDIARIAGVSIATISRVLHDSPLVDTDTTQRVQSIIRDLNYIPNTIGAASSRAKAVFTD